MMHKATFACCLRTVHDGLQISGVVGEQELGLRQMLRTMGMLDSTYWLSWMLFEVGWPCIIDITWHVMALA